jgi:hypothetical protein
MRRIPLRPLRIALFSTVGTASVFGALLSEASAQTVPSAFVDRHIVLPEGTLRIDAGHHFPFYDAQFKHVIVRNGDDPQFINPGVSYGLGSDVELGLVWPIQISPNGDVRDPRAHVTFQFHRGAEVEAAIFGLLEVGLWGETAVTTGVPLFWRASRDIRLDTGAYVRLGFNDASRIGLTLPAQLPIQISPEFFAGPEAIVTIGDLGNPGADFHLGGFFGYTLEASKASVLDLYTRLRARSIQDSVPAVELMFGLEWFIPT